MTFVTMRDPYKKTYHFGAKVNDLGQVSALCFKAPRPINLKRALWTNRREAVTCRKCLAAFEARDQQASMAVKP